MFLYEANGFQWFIICSSLVCSAYLAIPEIRWTSPKEDTGIPKYLPVVFIGNSPKIITFLVTRIKKTWEFLKCLIVLGRKKGVPNFLSPYLEFNFLDKIQAWESPNF